MPLPRTDTVVTFPSGALVSAAIVLHVEPARWANSARCGQH